MITEDFGPSHNTKTLLCCALDAAVPLWIHQLQQKPWSYVEERAHFCGEDIAVHGDVLQFRSKGTADAFNRLAEGLACLAFGLTGVTFMDRHWKAQHRDCGE